MSNVNVTNVNVNGTIASPASAASATQQSAQQQQSAPTPTPQQASDLAELKEHYKENTKQHQPLSLFNLVIRDDMEKVFNGMSDMLRTRVSVTDKGVAVEQDSKGRSDFWNVVIRPSNQDKEVTNDEVRVGCCCLFLLYFCTFTHCHVNVTIVVS